MTEAIPRLSATGWTRTEKFWISPVGEIIPLCGMWHYQWALTHREVHGVDLCVEEEEQPVRLRMLASGWWRVNFERRTCRLTVEGDVAGMNEKAVRAVVSLVAVNSKNLNEIRINLLDRQRVLAASVFNAVEACGDDASDEVREWLRARSR